MTSADHRPVSKTPPTLAGVVSCIRRLQLSAYEKNRRYHRQPGCEFARRAAGNPKLILQTERICSNELYLANKTWIRIKAIKNESPAWSLLPIKYDTESYLTPLCDLPYAAK